MREIKFRAWVECGNWLAYFNLGSELASYAFECVEQFTGLHDKNGKEIYEGDIVNGPNVIELVTYRDDYGMFGSGNGTCWGGMLSNGEGICVEEVIGNIHENPELIEK